jgi:hypothetical protein
MSHDHAIEITPQLCFSVEIIAHSFLTNSFSGADRTIEHSFGYLLHGRAPLETSSIRLRLCLVKVTDLKQAFKVCQVVAASLYQDSDQNYRPYTRLYLEVSAAQLVHRSISSTSYSQLNRPTNDKHRYYEKAADNNSSQHDRHRHDGRLLHIRRLLGHRHAQQVRQPLRWLNRELQQRSGTHCSIPILSITCSQFTSNKSKPLTKPTEQTATSSKKRSSSLLTSQESPSTKS